MASAIAPLPCDDDGTAPWYAGRRAATPRSDGGSHSNGSSLKRQMAQLSTEDEEECSQGMRAAVAAGSTPRPPKRTCAVHDLVHWGSGSSSSIESTCDSSEEEGLYPERRLLRRVATPFYRPLQQPEQPEQPEQRLQQQHPAAIPPAHRPPRPAPPAQDSQQQQQQQQQGPPGPAAVSAISRGAGPPASPASHGMLSVAAAIQQQPQQQHGCYGWPENSQEDELSTADLYGEDSRSPGEDGPFRSDQLPKGSVARFVMQQSEWGCERHLDPAVAERSARAAASEAQGFIAAGYPAPIKPPRASQNPTLEEAQAQAQAFHRELVAANAALSSLPLPDGLCFVPVHSTCSIWGAARCCSIPVIAVCLGASYFQRLLYHNATLHARAQQLGYFFQQRGDPTTFMGVPERASIRVEDELVAVYATCVYIACKATDRVHFRNQLTFMLHLLSPLKAAQYPADYPARLEMDVLCSLRWRLGPFFACQPDPAFANSSEGEEEEWDEEGDVDSVPSSGATTWLREAAS